MNGFVDVCLIFGVWMDKWINRLVDRWFVREISSVICRVYDVAIDFVDGA